MSTLLGRCNVQAAYSRGVNVSRVEHGAALAGDRAVFHQRVDHHVADEVDFLGRDAFGAQIVGGVALGGEQVVGNLVGQDAVDFFRHAAVAAAKAGLDMGDLDAALHRDERAAERRIDVADDQDDVGGMIVERLVERGHDARGLHRVARGAHFEMEVGVRNLKVAKELRRHMVVVVLPGVHQSQVDRGDVWAAWMMGATFMKFGRAPAMIVRLKCRVKEPPLKYGDKSLLNVALLSSFVMF